MLHRLWLTDDQVKALNKAIRNQIYRLDKFSREEKDIELSIKYGQEANILDTILDITDKEV